MQISWCLVTNTYYRCILSSHASPLQQDVYCLNFQVALGAFGDNGTPSCQSMCPMRPTHRDRDDRSWPLAFPTAIFGLSDQSDAETCEACCLKDSLEPQTTIYKWMFQLDDSKSLYRKSLFHQTSIYKWLFKVPRDDIYFGILKGKSSLGGAWHVRCDSLIIYWSETLNSSESQCRFAQLHSYSWHPECRQVSNGLQFRVGFKPAAFLFLPFYINEDLSCLFWELFVQIGTEFQVSPGGHWRICAMQRKTWRPMISHSFAPHFHHHHHHHHHHQTLLLTSNPPIHPWSTHSPWNLLLFCRQDWCACDHRVCDCQQILAFARLRCTTRCGSDGWLAAAALALGSSATVLSCVTEGSDHVNKSQAFATSEWGDVGIFFAQLLVALPPFKNRSRNEVKHSVGEILEQTLSYKALTWPCCPLHPIASYRIIAPSGRISLWATPPCRVLVKVQFRNSCWAIQVLIKRCMEIFGDLASRIVWLN